MPDADDFDVEYFRNLLQGRVEQNTTQTNPGKPAAPAKRKKSPAAATAPAKGRGTPTGKPKKPGKR